jgi:hypothetical protein
LNDVSYIADLYVHCVFLGMRGIQTVV